MNTERQAGDIDVALVLPRLPPPSHFIRQALDVTLRRKAKAIRAAEVLFDPSKIDLVGLAPDGTTVELYIVADAPWTGSAAQIRLLQAKLHAYVGFAVDGQMATEFPETAGLPWRLVVRCLSGAPDERTADVLRRTVEPVRGYSGDLDVRAGGDPRWPNPTRHLASGARRLPPPRTARATPSERPTPGTSRRVEARGCFDVSVAPDPRHRTVVAELSRPAGNSG